MALWWGHSTSRGLLTPWEHISSTFELKSPGTFARWTVGPGAKMLSPRSPGCQEPHNQWNFYLTGKRNPCWNLGRIAGPQNGSVARPQRCSLAQKHSGNFPRSGVYRHQVRRNENIKKGAWPSSLKGDRGSVSKETITALFELATGPSIFVAPPWLQPRGLHPSMSCPRPPSWSPSTKVPRLAGVEGRRK